ncbi:MAG: tripartite tricarboxylate transporter substrate binding protein [Deltaproteobacteria bacterium]|nr:tripartite tricarboxylate transporter substrate binding protein [Deltaproteobacteria bacterium]
MRAVKISLMAFVVMISLLWVFQATFAADFPAKPVNLIVCYGAGGSTDTVIRAFNDQLGKQLGVPAVVLNKPGSGGLVGALFAKKAKPDGYTVLVLSLSHLLRMAIDPGIPLDVFRDFAPVSRFVNQPLLLGVGKDSKFNTLDDLISYAKQNPRKVSYGSAGIGATGHFAAELFCSTAKIKVKHVPFKGDAATTTATMGGHVDWSVTGLPKFGPKAASGDVKVLAAFTKERIPEMKDVPTFGEKGYPEVIMYSWFGFAVPKKTPKEIIAKLDKAIGAAIKDPITQKNLKNLLFNDWYIGPAEFSEFIKSDYERFKKVAEEAGIKVKQ